MGGEPAFTDPSRRKDDCTRAFPQSRSRFAPSRNAAGATVGMRMRFNPIERSASHHNRCAALETPCGNRGQPFFLHADGRVDCDERMNTNRPAARCGLPQDCLGHPGSDRPRIEVKHSGADDGYERFEILRWAIALSGAVIVHVSLAVWLLRQPVQTIEASTPMLVTLIELAAEPIAPQPPPSSEVEPALKKTEPAKTAAKPRKPPSIEAKAEAIDPQPSEPQQEEVAAEQIEPMSVPPAEKAPAAEEAAVSVPLSTPGRAAALANWQGILLGHLERHRRYPASAQRRRQEGVAYLRFSVDRGGRLVVFALERSSGFELLDEETLAVIQRAQPLPPPPREIEGNPVEVVVPVQFAIRRR
jgi:protein TonB